MDAGEQQPNRDAATLERVAAVWARIDARRHAQDAEAFGEQGGPLGSAAQPNAEAIQSLGGADPSNTHPQSSQVELVGYPDCRVSWGIDWWEVRAAVQFNPISLLGLEDFAEAKRQCQELGQSERWLELQGLEPIAVGRTGLSAGRGKEHYEFKIVWRGITLGLAHRQGERDGKPNSLVRLTGRECLLRGAHPAYESVKQMFDLLGAVFLWEKLSRVDICFDVVGLDVRAFRPLITGRCFVTRARSVVPQENAVGDQWTGFVVGKRPARLIAYDKLQEQESKADALSLAALLQRRWGGVQPTYATRVEFQLSREWLVEHGVSTPDDFLQSSPALIAALMSDWFRLTTQSVESQAKHQARMLTHPLWESLQQAFLNCLGRPIQPLPRIERARISPNKLVKQALGCLRNAALQTGFACSTWESFQQVIPQLCNGALASSVQRASFMRDFARLQSRYVA